MAMVFAVPLQKTHSITFEARQVCYRWHRWYGRNVLTRRAGGAHADVSYFCRLPETAVDTMLVEVPRWMFDGAECATMQLVEQPHVDCGTLRQLKHAITEQHVSVRAAMLQPQGPRQAGHGDMDGDDFTSNTNDTASAIRRTSRRPALVRSNRAQARRGDQTSSPAARQCTNEQPSLRTSKTRRAK
jgi:hypothetical protein